VSRGAVRGRARFRAAAALAAALAAAAAGLALAPLACGGRGAERAPVAAAALDTLGVSEFPAFVDSFNRASDRTRVLTLLSPT